MEHKKKVPTLFDTCPLHLDMCSAGYRILSHYWPAWLPLFYSGNHHIGCLVLLLPLHALLHSGADQNLDLVPHLHNKHLHVHNELWFSDWLNQNAKILQNYFTLYFRSKFWIHLSFAIWIKRKETHLWPKKIIKDLFPQAPCIRSNAVTLIHLTVVSRGENSSFLILVNFWILSYSHLQIL